MTEGGTSTASSSSTGQDGGIPDQIWRRVFSFALGFIQANIPVRPGDERWTLRNVCSTWRRLVDTPPELWTFVTFHGIPTPAPSGEHLRLAEWWTKLTEGTYVLVSIEVKQVDPHVVLTYDRGLFSVVEKIIVPCARRIIFFHATFVSNEEIRSFLTIPAGRLLNAKTIVVRLGRPGRRAGPSRWRFHWWEPEMFTVFHDLPHLNGVVCHNFIRIRVEMLRLPHDQLSAMRFEEVVMDSKTFYTILREVKQLYHGSFGVKFGNEKMVWGGRTVPFKTRKALPSVENLILTLIHPGKDVRGVLRFFKFTNPNVDVEVRLKGEGDNSRSKKTDKWPFRALEPLIDGMQDLAHLSIMPVQRRVAKLNNLDYGGSIQPLLPGRNQLYDLLSSVESINELHLHVSLGLNDQILHDIKSGELLPLLKRLLVGTKHAWEILEMVKDRNERAVFNRTALGVFNRTALGGV